MLLSVQRCFYIFQVLNCTACPAGMQCASDAQAPVACTAGYYSAETQMDCSQCPIDQSCTDPAAAPVNCKSGYWSPLVSKLQITPVHLIYCLLDRFNGILIEWIKQESRMTYGTAVSSIVFILN